jgi:hypothetical protein
VRDLKFKNSQLSYSVQHGYRLINLIESLCAFIVVILMHNLGNFGIVRVEAILREMGKAKQIGGT